MHALNDGLDPLGPRDVVDELEVIQSIVAGEHMLAIAADRERIARDLHDSVIQRLFGVGLSLQAALPGANPRTQRRLHDAIDVLDDTIKELRNAIFFLNRTDRAPGLVRERLCALLQETAPLLGFTPQLRFDGAVETVFPEIEIHLIATVREALSNIVQHATATLVMLTVSVHDDAALTVLDNGTGFDSSAVAGCGLLNMESRAVECGGGFSLTHPATGGTLLDWRVPNRAKTPILNR